MSKNAFLTVLGALIAATLGGITGLVSYALIAAVMLLAGLAYEAAKVFHKGFRDGLTQRPAQPKRGTPHLYLVK